MKNDTYSTDNTHENKYCFHTETLTEDYNSSMWDLDNHSTIIFDKIESRDGFDIYWIHRGTEKTIDPDNLYTDEYSFMDSCEEILRDGKYQSENIDTIINFTIDLEDLKEWAKDRKLILAD